MTSVWCVSEIPSSHGNPADLMPVQLLAPVPPSWPEIVMCSALPCIIHTSPLEVITEYVTGIHLKLHCTVILGTNIVRGPRL